jgi:hypothetical protein
MNAQQVPQCKKRRVTYLLTYIFKKNKKTKTKREQHRVLSTSTCGFPITINLGSPYLAYILMIEGAY